MSSSAIVARPLEEKLVFAAWVGVWPLYAIGALYIAGPVLTAVLIGLIAWRAYAGALLPKEQRLAPIPVAIWIWLFAMAAMLLALIVGHTQEGLGGGKTIKSTIGWAKGWLLLAVFPLAGACLNIRLDTLCRANRWFVVSMLIATPLLLLAHAVGLPTKVFVSPLKVVGGSGPEYFTFFLYALDPESGGARLQYIAPWAPAAGLVANVMLVLSMEDARPTWRTIGVITSVLVVLLCQSRMALLCMLMAWPCASLISQLSRGWPVLAASVSALVGSLLAAPIASTVMSTIDKVNGMRSGSNRVRGVLNEMAFDRWWTEARIWGHGIVENGPHVVEYMPIGSHHTWLGLLFVKGAIGFVAFSVAMVWTTFELMIVSQYKRQARGALAMIFIMWFFSFSENLEMLAYLYWPGLVVIGIGLRSGARSPSRSVTPEL